MVAASLRQLWPTRWGGQRQLHARVSTNCCATSVPRSVPRCHAGRQATPTWSDANMPVSNVDANVSNWKFRLKLNAGAVADRQATTGSPVLTASRYINDSVITVSFPSVQDHDVGSIAITACTTGQIHRVQVAKTEACGIHPHTIHNLIHIFFKKIPQCLDG